MTSAASLLDRLPEFHPSTGPAFYDNAEDFVQRKACAVYVNTNRAEPRAKIPVASDLSDLLEKAIQARLRPLKRKLEDCTYATPKGKQTAAVETPAVEAGPRLPKWLVYAERQCRLSLRHCSPDITRRRKVMADNCTSWKLPQLQEFCKLAGLPKSGTKGELVLRVARYLRPPLDLDD